MRAAILKQDHPGRAASATNARCTALQRALVADERGGTQGRPLPSGIGSAAPAAGFTQAVPPLRLPLAAANARPKRNGNDSDGRQSDCLNSCDGAFACLRE